MQKLDIKVKPLRDTSDTLIPLYVIRGDGPRAGTIKTEYVGPNKSTFFAHCFWEADGNGRRTRLTHATIHPIYQERGWRLLQTEYEREGRSHDWEQFLSFQDACRDGQFELKNMDKEEVQAWRKDPCPGFPTDMLPKYCQDLAKKAVGPSARWKPVREGEKASESAEKESNGSEAELASELPADGGSRNSGAPAPARSRRRS